MQGEDGAAVRGGEGGRGGAEDGGEGGYFAFSGEEDEYGPVFGVSRVVGAFFADGEYEPGDEVVVDLGGGAGGRLPSTRSSVFVPATFRRDL